LLLLLDKGGKPRFAEPLGDLPHRLQQGLQQESVLLLRLAHKEGPIQAKHQEEAAS